MNQFWTTLPRPFFALAPMDGVTDAVFREVISRAAPADVLFTEFVNATSFCNPKGTHSTSSRLALSDQEKQGAVPVVAQIWGTNPDHFAEMSLALANRGFAGIDINMGCPVKDVVKTGACSAFIETPELAANLIAAAKKGGLPVSVKTRIGFKTIKTREWLSHLLRQDIAALTVHARTAKEMSKPPAHWDEFATAVELRNTIAPHTLIIGNGDILNRPHGQALARQYGLDGVMIGRGIFTDPFAFAAAPHPYRQEELLELLSTHLDLFDSQATLRRFDPLKRFFKIYIRDFAGASELRAALMTSRNTTEVRKIIAENMQTR